MKTADQQKLIDDLYLNEQILFMTFPKMVDQVVINLMPKHVVSVLSNGVVVRHQAPELPSFGDTRLDPLGIKMAGLGIDYDRTRDRNDCLYPESIRDGFYRAGAKCEMPGCSEDIVSNGKLMGHFGAIYNHYTEESKLPFTDLIHKRHTAPSFALITRPLSMQASWQHSEIRTHSTTN
ncbi:hypothetical protein QZH46_06710 [Pseudomonas corrugata]